MNRQNPKDNIDEIGKCLISLGIEKSQLMPRSIVQFNLRQHEPEFNLFQATATGIFPLDWFYSNDDDIGYFSCCKFGFAFLPQRDDVDDAFEWREVQVEVYNEMTNKWRVKTESDDCYEVSRVYLMFAVEVPMMFAQRIRHAIEFRAECEKRLRFEAFVDQIPLSHIPKPPQRIRTKIRDLLSHRRCHGKSHTDSGWLELFEWEYCMIYQRMAARDEFLRFAKMPRMETQPSSLFAAIQLPTMDKKLENVVSPSRQKSSSKATLRMTFEQSRRDFQRIWLYCCPEAIKIMDIVNDNCDSVTRMSLFHIQTLHEDERNVDEQIVIDLNGFVDAHDGKLSTMSNFFRREWNDFVVEKMKFYLGEGVGGWFDVNVNDWYVYENSKLFRLIELVRMRMEIAMRDNVRLSTRSYVNLLCDPCEKFLTLPEDFVWSSAMTISPFHSAHPVFTLEIVFDEVNSEYVYSIRNLDEFRVNIIRIFNSTILVTHEVPHLDPFLVGNLKFDRSLRLSPVGTHDEEIRNHLQRLEMCYRACVGPLKAYLSEFERFREFRVLNVSDYLEREKMLNSSELKDEIDSQLQQIDKVKQTVPSSIVIGPFEVEVEKVRNELIVKRKNLHVSLRRMFIDRIESSLTAIKLKFDGIFSKLTQHVECVEEIVEMRNWIPNIPHEVKIVEKQLEDVEYDGIDILAQLSIPLRDEMFVTFVHNRLMPANILSRIEDVESRLTFEFEQFRKLQMTHQVNFIEQVDSIVAATEVEIYSTKQHDDDMGGNVEKVWNVLDNLRKHGAMLNNRHRIFNQPEIDMTTLNDVVERVSPYHNFFITTSNFLKTTNKWTRALANMTENDLNIFDAEMKRCEDVVVESRRYFNDNEKMMMAIGKFSSTVVEPSRRKLAVLHALTNPDLDEEHLRLMSKSTGIKIKFTPDLTLESLVVRGILDKSQIVGEVSQAATSARVARDEAKKEAERKLQAEVELTKTKKARLAARKDI